MQAVDIQRTSAGPITPSAAGGAGRFELKFTVPERRARALAAWLDATCSVDPAFPVGHVRTLYLDTSGHRLLGQKVNSDYLKAKVRIRWYSAGRSLPAAGSAWVEVKRKEGGLGWKHRAEIPGGAAMLDGVSPSSVELEPFLAPLRHDGLRLPPLTASLALTYLRRRWVHADGATRVALDTDIELRWARPGRRAARPGRPLSVAVIELKGPAREVPRTLRSLARFGARRESFSKYYECLR